MDQVNTQEQLAKALGVTRQRLAEWKRRGAPIGSKGPYDVSQVRSWANENLERSKVSNQVESMNALRREKLKAEVAIKRQQARQEKIRTQKMEKSVIDVAFAVEIAVENGVRVRNRFMALPRAIAQDLVHLETPAEAEAILREAVWDALDELAQGRDVQIQRLKSEQSGEQEQEEPSE